MAGSKCGVVNYGNGAGIEWAKEDNYEYDKSELNKGKKVKEAPKRRKPRGFIESIIYDIENWNKL